MTDPELDYFGKGLGVGLFVSLIIAAVIIHSIVSKKELCRDTHGPNATAHGGKCVKVVPFEKEKRDEPK